MSTNPCREIRRRFNAHAQRPFHHLARPSADRSTPRFSDVRLGTPLPRLTPCTCVLYLFPVAIETLGEALSCGWRVTARCAHGRRDGMKSIKECVYRAELDMETLVWTRGRRFPLSRLETRLRCPMCGLRDVRLIFTAPREAQTVRGAKPRPK